MNKHEYAALFEQRARRAEADGFRDWLATPTVQLMLSLIPPAHPPEVVKTLLRECFESGMRTGLCLMTLHLATTVLKASPDEKDKPDAKH